MIKKFLAETKTDDTSKYSESTKYMYVASAGACWMALIISLIIVINDTTNFFNLNQVHSIIIKFASSIVIIPLVSVIVYKCICNLIQEFVGNKQ